MKCLFIHFSIDTTTYYSHAIAILAAIAKEANYDVDILVVNNKGYKQYVNEIIEKCPDIIAFSLTSRYWFEAKELAERIKKEISVPLWVGGSHINAMPQSFFDSPFDAACYGDGESIFKNALISQAKKEVYKSNSWLRKDYKNNNFLINIDDMNTYPLPYLNLFSPTVVLAYPSLFFSKGCIYSCNYCMSRKGGYAKKIRWKQVTRAIEECLHLIEYCQPNELYFDDDTFVKDLIWVESFLELYSRKVRVPFYCNSRPELLSDKICKLLSDNYCRGVGIGIESGSEDLRIKILGRKMTNKQIEDAFSICKKYGLETWSFNMVDIPSETIDDLQKTIDLNNLVDPDYARVSIFTPFPGSPMQEELASYDSYFEKDCILTSSPLKNSLYKSWIDDLNKKGKLWND